MMVTCQPRARQRSQRIRACSQASMDPQPGDAFGTLACHFDDVTEWRAWHRACLMRFDGSPIAMEVVVTDAAGDV